MGEVSTPAAQSNRQITPGTRIGRYRVLKRIAAGGMAEVYLARAEGGGLARPVALKLVLPHLAHEEKFVRLFQQEARIALHLDHPNIAQVLELDRDGSELFLVMEFVDGFTLQDVLAASHGALPLPCALSLISQTCAAIHHAHEAKSADGTPLQLVHRDISPSNVMVRHDGVVKVVDFGIAKALAETGLTKTGSLKGKAGYMSTEQCRGEALDRRSDVFNLGILLYETTLGRRAFSGANIFAVMNKIVDGRFIAPSRADPNYPAALESLVIRAMSRDPEDRPPTAHSVREEVEAFAREHGHALGEATVAATIKNLMGRPEPVPEPIDALLPPPRESVEPDSAHRSGLPAWLKATAVGAAAGAVAFIALRRNADELEPPVSDDLKNQGAVVEPSAAPARVTDRTIGEQVEARVETEAATPVAKAPESTVDAPEPAAPHASPRRKASRRRKARPADKKRPVKKVPAENLDEEPLFPWKERTK